VTPAPTATPALAPARHVVLVGLPGTGKTTAGRLLARLLERPFADADEQLELATGSTVTHLHHRHGEDRVRLMEAELLATLLDRATPLVVSAPGGMPLPAEVRTHLARTAIVVWFRAPPRLLTQRSDPTHRPRLAAGHEAGLSRLDAEHAPDYAAVATHELDIAPVHAATAPAVAIATHLVRVLTAAGPGGGVPLPAPTPGETIGYLAALTRTDREAATHLDAVADHVVDVEPFLRGRRG
jgi:shikimate kinase